MGTDKADVSSKKDKKKNKNKEKTIPLKSTCGRRRRSAGLPRN
jgi:hypothetical protein